MPIPETQLETWSHQGAVVTAKETHESIRRALLSESSLVREKAFEVYLQGSYKNDTNVRADSDVDVVVEINSTFSGDVTTLMAWERAAWDAAYPNATYHWTAFREDVLKTLRSYFGHPNITEGTKSLKLTAAPGRLAADIIPCQRHLKFEFFANASLEGHVEGIQFWTHPAHQVIINFPKLHYDNGVRKNSAGRTDGWFKPTVRMLKNARTRCVDLGLLPSERAPSYFIECLAYNAPDSAFGPTFQSTYAQVHDILQGQDFAGLQCQNEQVPLFGPTPQQWSAQSASALLRALGDLWRSW